MDPRALFGLSIAMNFTSAIVAARLLVWPRLRRSPRSTALIWLVAPHMFLRFIGLSFLIPGVVDPALPAAFAAPAGFGDLATGVLAIVATIGLARHTSWAIGSVWLFNIVGAADLVLAFIQGARSGLEPGMLGAGFYIVTSVVPLLLVSHALVFRVLAHR